MARRGAPAPEVIGALAELLASHGKDAASRPTPYPVERHAELVEALKQWADVLLRSEDATRAQMAHLARAITRVPDPGLFEPLRLLLAEDLARWKTARDAFLKELHRGRQSSGDSHMSWENCYRDALSAIGGPDVKALMIGYLPDAGYCGFGETAAWVLKDLAEQGPAPSDEERPLMRSEFAGVMARRAHLLAGDRQGHPAADAIFAVIGNCVGAEQGQEAHRHALTLARPALLMPHRRQDALVRTILELPLPWSQKQPVLKALVISGEVVDAEMILAGIRELLEDAKSKVWLLDENSGRLESWLTLLPFSNRQAALLDVLTWLSPEETSPWRLRPVLSALGFGSSPDAEQVLQDLVRFDPRFIAEHAWLAALQRLKSLASGRVILRVASEADPSSIRPGGARTHPRALADAATTHPEIRQELYEHYATLEQGEAKSIIEVAIAEAPDAQGVLILVRSHGVEGRHLRQTQIYTALRNLFTTRRPSVQFKGHEEVVGVPAPGLRQALFALALQNGPVATLAIESLDAIDDLREEFGSGISEPRHPDISANRPWPLIENWRKLA